MIQSIHSYSIFHGEKHPDDNKTKYIPTQNSDIQVKIEMEESRDYRFATTEPETMGKGWKGEYFPGVTDDNKPCAIGVYRELGLRNTLYRAISGAQFNNLHIPKVLGTTAVKDSSGFYYPSIVFERVFGENGRTWLEMGFTKEDLYGVLLQISEAIDYIHSQNCIHNDIKWGNIMVGSTDSEKKEQKNAYQLDIESIIHLNSTSHHDMINMTVPYMTPEQAKAVVEETDLKNTKYIDYWKLGVMYLVAISHQKIQTPFISTNNREINDWEKTSLKLYEAKRQGIMSFPREYMHNDFLPQYEEIVKKLSIFFGEKEVSGNYRTFSSANDVIKYLFESSAGDTIPY